MALTREIELHLERVSLVAYFNANEAAWRKAAQNAYDYTKTAFDGGMVREDDIAKSLRTVIEVHRGLRKVLDAKRLSQKYWLDRFNDLVVDRSWDTLKK
jgi:hypothetical protein